MNVSYSKSKALFGVYVVLLITLVVFTFLFLRSVPEYSFLTTVSFAVNLLLGWWLVPVKVFEYYYLHKALDVLNSIKGVFPKLMNKPDPNHRREFDIAQLEGGIAVSVVPDRSATRGRIGPVYILWAGSDVAKVKFDLGRPERWWETWIGARITSARMLRAISKMLEPPAKGPHTPLVPPDL